MSIQHHIVLNACYPQCCSVNLLNMQFCWIWEIRLDTGPLKKKMGEFKVFARLLSRIVFSDLQTFLCFSNNSFIPAFFLRCVFILSLHGCNSEINSLRKLLCLYIALHKLFTNKRDTFNKTYYTIQ